MSREVQFFEADRLTFGIRVIDGTALVTRGCGPAARSVLRRRLAELPAREYDLMCGSHVPSLNRSRLTLMIAQRCNLRCVYCYGEAGEYGNPSVMSPETSLRLLDQFFERSGPRQRTINFFGGEPLLSFDLLRELTTRAVQNGVRHDRHPIFTMTTNATLVTPAISAWLARHRFSIMVSIDGDRDMHSRNRPDARGESSWDATVQGARWLLRDLGPQAVTARATLTAGFPDVGDMVRGLEDIGFQSVVLSPVEPVGHSDVAALTPGDYRRLREAIAEMAVPARLRHNGSATWDPLKHTIELLLTGKRRRRACGVGSLSTAVSSDGYLYPCHRYVGDSRFIIGTADDGLVNDSLPGFVAFEASRCSALEECHRCLAKTFCAGSCAHIAVERMDRGLLPHAPELCDFIRMGVIDGMRVVAGLRIPPPEGSAAPLGPEYMKRPCDAQTLQLVLERRGRRFLDQAVWREHDRDVIRASYETIVAHIGRIIETFPRQARDQSGDWLTFGLLEFLVGSGVMDPLSEPELRIVGSSAAMTGILDASVVSKCLRAGRGVLEGELHALIEELVEARCIDREPNLVRVMPSLALARKRADEELEGSLRSFVSLVAPLRGWIEDYERLCLPTRDRRTNPWSTMIHETFGQLSSADETSLVRHPAVIDMAAAHVTVELRRSMPQVPWHKRAAEAYVAWLLDRLRQFEASVCETACASRSSSTGAETHSSSWPAPSPSG